MAELYRKIWMFAFWVCTKYNSWNDCWFRSV